MKNFPYENALDYFLQPKDRRGVGARPSAMKRPHSVAFVDEDLIDSLYGLG